ncbi:VWA domain-containing protein [Paenibacillus sp. IHBB 10380]|uniref:VWA domain-containing protein n=1 Tax=Paenibacillus sp. IHBB 10380 TaxID=1566358 RepID=UPI0005CFE759|nr:VWA domain-containing protein [Paenibacillus sp. IHBB 10380]AJS60964.1 von Willebrand factor A [Paenibacillus sp. IHBB 10380]
MLRRNQLTFRLLMVLSLLLMPLSGRLPEASAAQRASQIDAMLVVDASNSMKTSDPNKIGNEAMKMFIDMLSAQGDKVGIIAYTDQIQREKALLEIKSTADKEDLKQFIDQLDRGPYTDTAVGIKEAVKVLQQGSDPSHEPMIVLLADGNNDFNKTKGRTQSQSDQELTQAVADANKSGIPVYTIGLNADGKLNKDALAQISKQTSGKAFSTDSADDLPQILSEIFASHLKLKIVPIQSINANGSYQDVTINVPNSNVLEANISIMSNKPVEVKLMDPTGASKSIPASDILFSESKSYSLLKLLSPVKGDWKLQVKGVAKDKIDINLVFNYDMELTMDPLPSKAYKKGDKIDIKSHLVSGGQNLQNNALYNNMTAKIIVTDLDTGDTKEVEMNNSGDLFEGTYKVADRHEYEIKVRAEDKSFYRETEPVKISAKAGGASTSNPLTGSDVPDKKSSPLLPIIIGVIALAVIAAAAYFILTAMRKANRGFVGQLVVEIRDENTGEKTYPQYKKLTAFKGKFNLHQVLQLAPELKETDKIMFVPGKNDRILLKNGSTVNIEKSGRVTDATQGLELKSGDRITIPLQSVDKTILIEYLV